MGFRHESDRNQREASHELTPEAPARRVRFMPTRPMPAQHLETLTRSPEAWRERVESIRAHLQGFHAEVTLLPPLQRLRLLAELRNGLDEASGELVEDAIVAARADGWGLRRIAVAAGISHEQVRRVLADHAAATGKDQPQGEG
jgi:hypothetical protein